MSADYVMLLADEAERRVVFVTEGKDAAAQSRHAAGEGLNSKTQLIKYRARGYRNADGFKRPSSFTSAGSTGHSPTRKAEKS